MCPNQRRPTVVRENGRWVTWIVFGLFAGAITVALIYPLVSDYLLMPGGLASNLTQVSSAAGSAGRAEPSLHGRVSG